VSTLAAIGYGPFNAGWLASTLVITAPILLATLGEVVSENAGVLNVGLEGMMLSGAFTSYYVAWKTNDPTLSLLAGAGGGLLFALIMALVAIEARADQIVSGIAINLLAIGATGFGYDQIFGGQNLVTVHTLGNIAIPGLSKIPGGIGNALFNHDIVLYLAALLVPATWLLLYRSKWGLLIRAAGETPEAVDTAGASVRRIRWIATLWAGCLSGVGGAYLVLADVGIFGQNMTAGRGYLALVAVIFGGWRPFGVALGALVFGGLEALQLRLAAVHALPSQVWLVVALVVAAFVLYRVTRGAARPAVARLPWPAVVLVVASATLFFAKPYISLTSDIYSLIPYVVALVLLTAALAKTRAPSKLTLPYTRG